ncbi:MAG TPA: peptidase S58, partial [Clostridiales bacterium]|nr:peptidase S58 [Clostridiales bacterium]
MLDKFKIGHADNDNTGVTVILSEGGATGGVHVMGGAPATRETDLLKSGNTVQKINA